MWTAAFAILICRKHGDKKTILRIIGICQCEVLLANSGMVTRYSRRRLTWWKRACKEPELSERIEMTRELKSHRAYGFSHAHAWVGSNWLKGCVSESNQSKILKRPSYKYPKPKRMYDKRNECARNREYVRIEAFGSVVSAYPTGDKVWRVFILYGYIFILIRIYLSS